MNDTLWGMLNFLIWKVAQVATLWHVRAHLHFQQLPVNSIGLLGFKPDLAAADMTGGGVGTGRD